MKKTLSVMIALLFLLLSACTGQAVLPTASTTPEPSQRVISEIPADYRSQKLSIDEALFKAAQAAFPRETVYSMKAEPVLDFKPLLDALAGKTLQEKLTLEDQTTSYQEYIAPDGGLIKQSQYKYHGIHYGSSLYKLFESDYYLRLITEMDSESISRHRYTTDRFPMNCDLPALQVADAKQALVDVLSSMDLHTDFSHITAYAFTKEALQAVAEDREKEGLLDPMISYDVDGNQIVKDPTDWYKTFSSEDECFYLVGQTLAGEIPLYQSCNVQAIWGADGFLFFNLFGAYFPDEATKASVNVINAGQAVSVLSEYYDARNFTTAEVVTMDFVYYPVRDADTIRLTPAWHFLMLEHVQSEADPEMIHRGEDLYFDATTGVQLLPEEAEESE